MVTAVTSLGRSGLSDWLIQRFTAVVLLAYTIFLVAFLVMNPELSYDRWTLLFSQLWMRAFSLLALVSIIAHGWIGLWGVITDYVTARMMGSKALILRICILALYALVALTVLVWGVELLWGL